MRIDKDRKTLVPDHGTFILDYGYLNLESFKTRGPDDLSFMSVTIYLNELNLTKRI